MALALSLKEIRRLGSGDRVAVATGELDLVNEVASLRLPGCSAFQGSILWEDPAGSSHFLLSAMVASAGVPGAPQHCSCQLRT